MLYVGRRRDAVGRERLVLVESVGSYTASPTASWSNNPVTRAYGLRAFALELGSWGTAPSDLPTVADVTLAVPIPTAAVQVYAGQDDPADESRFSIDFGRGTGATTVVGRLLPDGSVSITVADGRATYPVEPMSPR